MAKVLAVNKPWECLMEVFEIFSETTASKLILVVSQEHKGRKPPV